VRGEGKVTEPDYIESWVRRNRGVRLDIDKDAAGCAPLTSGVWRLIESILG